MPWRSTTALLVGWVLAAACPTTCVASAHCPSITTVHPPTHLHADATKGCRLASVPMTAASWQIAGPEAQVTFRSNASAELALVKDQGLRLNSLDRTGHGLYSARVRACRQSGCVSAFYLTR